MSFKNIMRGEISPKKIPTRKEKSFERLSKMKDITMTSLVDEGIDPINENQVGGNEPNKLGGGEYSNTNAGLEGNDTDGEDGHGKAGKIKTKVSDGSGSKTGPGNGCIQRTFSVATEEYLESRRENERREKRTAKQKVDLGYVVTAFVLVILWVGYLSMIIFLLYGFLKEEDITQEQAFNQTYQDMGNCTGINSAFNKYSIFANALINSSYNNSPFPVTDCPVDFINNRTHCTPECLRFTPGGRTMWYAFRVTTIIGSSFTIIATFIGMLSWVNRELWKFPKVVNFYMMVTVMLQGIAILSGAILPKEYFCSNPNIDVSRKLSTYPCLVQGAVIQYALLGFLFWYIFAISNLAIHIFGPIRGARWFYNHNVKIHIVESIIGWGVPLLFVFITVIVSVAEGKPRSAYRIENVPEFCIPGIVEIQITSLQAIGSIFCIFNGTMITIIVLIMIKLKYNQTRLTKSTIVNTEWVFQLSIFTLIFSLSIWIVLLDTSIYIYYEDAYQNHLRAYTYCITLFPTSCCQATYQTFYQPWLSTLAGFSTSIWGIGGLTAVTNKEVRLFWKKQILKICKFGKA